MFCKGYGKISGLVSLVKVDGLEILDKLVNLVILVNLVLQVNLASLAKLVNLAQQPCALINFPISFFLLVTFPPCYFPSCYFLLSPYYLLLPPYYFTTSSLLLITFSLLPSPFYLEKTTTPSPFIPSINMRKGCSKRTCLTCCVSSMAGMASRISLRKRPSGMFVSIVK